MSVEKSQPPSTPPRPVPKPKPPTTKPLKHSTTTHIPTKNITTNLPPSTSSAGLVKKSVTTTQLNKSRPQASGDDDKNELRGMFMRMKQSRAAVLVEEETSRIKPEVIEDEEGIAGT